MTYYWNPQQGYAQNPSQGFPTSAQQGVPSPFPPAQPATPALRREESYIENILRLNRSKPGNFFFSFENAIEGSKTKQIRGVVEAAGRDHVILRELKSNHRFLMPMIYFDYAEFDEELKYFTQTP